MGYGRLARRPIALRVKDTQHRYSMSFADHRQGKSADPVTEEAEMRPDADPSITRLTGGFSHPLKLECLRVAFALDDAARPFGF